MELFKRQSDRLTTIFHWLFAHPNRFYFFEKEHIKWSGPAKDWKLIDRLKSLVTLTSPFQSDFFFFFFFPFYLLSTRSRRVYRSGKRHSRASILLLSPHPMLQRKPPSQPTPSSPRLKREKLLLCKSFSTFLWTTLQFVKTFLISAEGEEEEKEEEKVEEEKEKEREWVRAT